MPETSSIWPPTNNRRTVISSLGQRAGLVRANDRGAAERLDRRESAHERVALDHPLDAERERDGDDRRQSFGDDGDRQGHAEDEHLDERLAAKQTERDDDQDDRERDARQRLADSVEVLLQGRLRRLDLSSIRAILPNSVAMPVATTTARPRP